MTADLDDALVIRDAIEALGFDIYEPLATHPQAVYSRGQLEAILRRALVGRRFDGRNKTRAKGAKQAVAVALGYPAPKSLRNTKPRFPGQDLDVYTQQSDNLQIYNEEVSPTRRYVVLRFDDGSRVTAVRVVEGVELAELDKTGTLTSKFQAKRLAGRAGSVLVGGSDTPAFIAELAPVDALDPGELGATPPVSPPQRGRVLAIAALHRKLLTLVGRELPYSPSERRRGDLLHRAVCEVLGLRGHEETGQFPDILCQALEVKLQFSPTIDLGLVAPISEDPALTLSPRLRHCDARYLIAYAVHGGDVFRIEHIVTSTGKRFFDEFRQFGGLVQNRKLQLRLPSGFFEAE